MTDTEQRPAVMSQVKRPVKPLLQRLRDVERDGMTLAGAAANAIENLSRQLDQAIKDADHAIEHARRVDAKEREALRSALRELTRIYKVDGAGRTSAAEIDAAWRAAHDALKT